MAGSVVTHKDLDRIYDKIDELRGEMEKMKISLAKLCDINPEKNGGWKSKLYFFLAGGLLAFGGRGLDILCNWLGIS